MKKIVLSLLIVSSMVFVSCKKNETETNKDNAEAVASAEGTIYKANPAESIIYWSGSKPTGKHMGTVNLQEGEFIVKDNKVVGGKFTINMNTITVTDLKPDDGKEDLEAHLKGTGDKKEQDHFFNVEKYPTGLFQIRRIEEENGKTVVFGNLSIKNVTKSVNFPATINVSDNEINFVSDSLVLNRTYWNITYGSKTIAGTLKDNLVHDEMILQVNVKAKK
ncbi:MULTISPECIES: YceI family protein [Flavobacterium]|uniref:YceI family protein n=1 Tax=Flavobacterium TaxID=237 RepID=UPI001FCAA162|nr:MULTISPECIES: YceI family protein [Flavobacterium]UOK42374.1 YceI family protein [Flavobacterium enshiense]